MPPQTPAAQAALAARHALADIDVALCLPPKHTAAAARTHTTESTAFPALHDDDNLSHCNAAAAANDKCVHPHAHDNVLLLLEAQARAAAYPVWP